MSKPRKCRYGKLRRPVGKRVCKRAPTNKKGSARAKRRVFSKTAAAKARRAKARRWSLKVQKDDAAYRKLSTSEKAAELKRRLPWMNPRHIDENPHLYGWRR